MKQNEGSEFLAYFPQWAPLFTQVKERYAHSTSSAAKRRARIGVAYAHHIYALRRYDELCNEAERAWDRVKHVEDHRTFAKICKEQYENELDEWVGSMSSRQSPCSAKYNDYLFLRRKGRCSSAR